MANFRRIGILGGSFNPIHLGHLVLAEQARELLRLEKIIFVPAYLRPHKRAGRLALAQERHHMISRALKSNPSFAVSDIELRRKGISYSIDTLNQFKCIFPHTSLYFIVGSDFLKEFSIWKDLSSFSKICKFVVALRPGYPLAKLPPAQARQGRGRLPGNMQTIEITSLDISSTAIRERIRKGQSIRYLVLEEVRRYILKKGLYR